LKRPRLLPQLTLSNYLSKLRLRVESAVFKTAIDDAGHGFAVVAGEVKEHSSHVASAMGQQNEATPDVLRCSVCESQVCKKHKYLLAMFRGS